MKTVTMGHYYPSNSLLHLLDPRTKLFSFILFVVLVFLCDSLFVFGLHSLCFIFTVVFSKIPLKYFFKGIKTTVLFLVITESIMIAINPDSYLYALLIVLRIIATIIASNCLLLTTKPRDISEGLEKSFGFLKGKAHDFFTIIEIAVRFIPILGDEAQNILMAQKARGMDFKNKTLIKKSKILVALLIPLFESALRRADQLSESMDSRLYGCGKKTRLHPLKFKSTDFVFLFIAVAYFIFVIIGDSCGFIC